MHLTQDILKCQHCLDFKIYILGTILINAYLIHRLTTKKNYDLLLYKGVIFLNLA